MINKYNEIFTLEKNPLTYVDLDEFNTPKKYYGFIMLNKYGEKLLAPMINKLVENNDISDDNLRLLGEIISARFLSTWRHINNTLEIEYNPIADYRITGTEKVKANNNTENTDSRNIQNFISGFNSEDDTSLDDSNSKSAGSSNRISEDNKDKIWTKEGITGATPIQEYISREINLRRLSTCDIIIEDVIRFITLAIY